MSDRVSRTILLCEDDHHESLVRFYLKRCGLRTEPPCLIVLNASRQAKGGNVGWVIGEYQRQLLACRKRHLAHASTLLIVLVDADEFTVEERRSQLIGDPPLSPDDPVVVLIPRRHIETWIRAALDEPVNESDSYKKPELKKLQLRNAADRIYLWARDNPPPGPTCTDSLRASLPQWRKIG